MRGKPTIFVGDTKFVTVYPQDAAANKTTMEKLAAIWADRLRATILKVGPTHGERIPDAEKPSDSVPPMVPPPGAAAEEPPPETTPAPGA